MASTKELQDLLLGELSRPMAERGFESRPRDQSFIRRMPFGQQTFHLSFVRHPTDVDVTTDVAIRIDALEDLLNERNEALPRSERKRTHSMGAELGNISAGAQKRWSLEREDDVRDTAASIVSLFVRVGLPYLEKYSNLERALSALSGDDQSSWLHSPFHDLRAKRALGLAYVLGRHATLDDLITAKRRFLKDRNDPGLPDFLAFADELKHRATAK